MRRQSPHEVSQRYGVSAGTVIEWCRTGIISAVDVASPTATRQRWRMSDEDFEEFEARRAKRQEVSA